MLDEADSMFTPRVSWSKTPKGRAIKDVAAGALHRFWWRLAVLAVKSIEARHLWGAVCVVVVVMFVDVTDFLWRWLRNPLDS